MDRCKCLQRTTLSPIFNVLDFLDFSRGAKNYLDVSLSSLNDNKICDRFHINRDELIFLLFQINRGT